MEKKRKKRRRVKGGDNEILIEKLCVIVRGRLLRVCMCVFVGERKTERE